MWEIVSRFIPTKNAHNVFPVVIILRIPFWGVYWAFDIWQIMLLAADYKNETEVGDALAGAFQSGLVKREDLFITTKVSLSANLWPLFV